MNRSSDYFLARAGRAVAWLAWGVAGWLAQAGLKAGRVLGRGRGGGRIMNLLQRIADKAGLLAADGRRRVWRVEVHPASAAEDAAGRAVLDEARELRLAEGVEQARTARVYLLETTLGEQAIEQVAEQLLADPVNQRYRLGVTPVDDGAPVVEVHYKPGVMDPVAMSAGDAIREMLGIGGEGAEGQGDREDPSPGLSPEGEGGVEGDEAGGVELEILTGYRYDFVGASREQADAIARRVLANPVIQTVAGEPHWPGEFPHAQPYQFKQVQVPIRKLDDAELARLSREGHLFLSLEEMQTIQRFYQEAGREPTDIELETLAQTWSEHCVHKTLKSRISYREPTSRDREGAVLPAARDWADRPGHELQGDGTLVIDNLLRSTVAAATNTLIEDGVDWCVSVFVDNAGVIRFDETDSVTFKVETHNRPSAIEPYGGAATGIGGCIRDTLGTGLAAKPIANTDVFAVADPNYPFEELPAGVIHPRRILTQIVAGVRDYGNRMGIPTVDGAVYFDNRYLGNPLVFAGSVGVIPTDKAHGDPQPGDRIIAIGGRTGKDGIHGATFSSAELTDTHADEFSHAVQIGNPITEKKVLDVILQARDHAEGCLYRAITDCGAGGFSSAIGEMGEKLGAEVDLERAPLKYAGLSYTDIWISEAQERMVLAVPAERVDALVALCEQEDVEAADLGRFGTENAELILRYEGHEVGRLPMDFVHEGLPQPVREAVLEGRGSTGGQGDSGGRGGEGGGGGGGRAGGGLTASLRARLGAEESEAVVEGPSLEVMLRRLLGHPNIASKHWVVRQYDHEVQGTSVVKPLLGPGGDGPSDAAVVRPKLDSTRGVALSCGLATGLADHDAYWMTLAAIDEALRNAVCVGARPDRIAILDNFCWPRCDEPGNLATLVRAAEACYDGALAYRSPFISGKDSLNNQFTMEDGQVIAIPPTLLISAIGIVEDTRRCVTMDAKAAGNLLVQVGLTQGRLGGSHAARCGFAEVNAAIPRVDLDLAPRLLAKVAELIAGGKVQAAHDCSDGGLLVAAAEMAFAGRVGLEADLAAVPHRAELSSTAAAFDESPSRVLIEVRPEDFDAVARTLREAEVPFGHVGTFNEGARLSVRDVRGEAVCDASLDALRRAWMEPLDW